jgi:predicted membrane protein DUF2232
MTAGAAPVPGRRASLGAAVILAAFLLQGAPALYFLGPFALLTLISRPRSARELFWLTAAGAGVAVMVSLDRVLAVQVIRVSGLLVTLAFVALSRRGHLPVLPRALIAVAFGAVGVAFWLRFQGLGWPDLERAFTEMLRATYDAWGKATAPQGGASAEMQTFVRQLHDMAPQIARIIPGLLALTAIGGCALSWVWHHRVAAAPLGKPPAPFRQFRFNDHLVWGAIVTLGSLLLPLPPPIRTLAINLLIVWAGLYVTRGLAIIAAVLTPAPGLLKVVVAGLAFLILPLTPGALVVLGLADTWIDIRGRFTPPAPGGT